MKIVAAYYFLLLYTLAVCKPILPLVKDGFAHMFWKAKHLASVHHHHGHHHAKEEVAEARHAENDKQPVTTKTCEPVSVHLVVETLYSVSLPIMHKQKFVVNISNLSTVSLNKDYPPPKYCTPA